MAKEIEVWKDIPEIPYLQASNLGNVRSVDHFIKSNFDNCGQVKRKGKLLKQYKEHYNRITIRKDGKTQKVYVHRLIASAFISNPNGYNYVNHIDGNKYNNRAENLEWCNQSDNVKHALETGLRINKRNENGRFISNKEKLI